MLAEPALTNIGIVLPEPGFLEGLRELCNRHGTLLLIDETHTFSAGPGGMTKEALAEETGYAADGGGFGNALGRLRTLELILGRGGESLRLAEEFFG